MSRPRLLRVALAAAMALLASPSLFAGSFAVTPIRLDFPPSVRAGAVTVVNSDPNSLGFQMKLLHWTQNAAGEDVYEDSKDLVYFPRLMTLEPGARRVIRVGAQAAAGDAEVCYRLAIDEMAQARQPGSAAQVAVRVRFAVPIFLAPRVPRVAVEIEGLSLKNGELKFRLLNQGNQHVRLEESQLLRGGRELGKGSGWYVLAGAQKEFSLRLADSGCGAPGVAMLGLKGEGLNFERDVSALFKACGQ